MVIVFRSSGSSRTRVRSGSRDVDHSAHPGMNAALKLVRAYWKVGTAGSRSYFNTTSRNENDRSEVQAFGSRNRVAGNAVELVNETAAKLCYRSKRVRLAAAVLDQRVATNIQMHVARLISPGVRILGCRKFSDELIESRVAIAYAGAIAKHRVEGCWLTVVQQPDLLVALNGARARSQTQQSER